jgi:hypothetical protein
MKPAPPVMRTFVILHSFDRLNGAPTIASEVSQS